MLLCCPGEYLKLVALISYSLAQILETSDCLKRLSIYVNLCVDATGVVCHQLSLLGTDLHAVEDTSITNDKRNTIQARCTFVGIISIFIVRGKFAPIFIVEYFIHKTGCVPREYRWLFPQSGTDAKGER